MATITNEEEFKAWLEDKPRDWAVVLAARSALRVLPLIKIWQRDDDPIIAANDHLLLNTFRAAAASWAFLKYRAYRAAFRASSISASAVEQVTPVARASIGAAAASNKSVAINSAAFAAHSAAQDAFSAADSSFVAGRSADAIWRALSSDTNRLEFGRNPAALAGEPLWWEGRPEVLASAWSDLKVDLLRQKQDWDVWTKWYEARLAGKRANRRDVEIFRVTLHDAVADGEFLKLTRAALEKLLRGHDADWEKGPAHVNALIKARMKKRRSGDVADQMDIPPPLPAAIQPEIINNKVAVRRSAARMIGKPESVEALVALLRAELRTLIDKARTNELNGDQRPADELEELFSDIPVGMLSTIDLFKIAHRLEFLKDALTHVEKEWSDLTVARFRAFLKTYQRAVDQFPDWHDFRSTATVQSQDLKAATATLERAQEAVVTLRSSVAEPFIDASVPNALDELTEPYKERVDAAQNDPAGGLINDGFFTEDFQRSLQNIAKKLIELLGPAANWSAPKVKNALLSIDGEVDRHSKNAGPLMTKLVKYSAALAVGQVAASNMPSTGNMTADWISQAVAHLAPVGVAAASEHKKGKKRGAAETPDDK